MVDEAEHRSLIGRFSPLQLLRRYGLGRGNPSVQQKAVTRIIFFGGYKSTLEDVTAWKTSANIKNPELDIIAYPYPMGASAGNPLEEWHNADGASKLVTPGTIIIGHSSGCALANAVATFVDPKIEFRLICLDGFRPHPLLRNKSVIWGAKNGAHISFNFGDDVQKVYRAKVIKRWPLHFSLVNLNVSDDYPEITDGYRNCNANLDVLLL